jgi:hypothetical protein
MAQLNYENIIKFALVVYPGFIDRIETVFFTTNFIFGPGLLIEFIKIRKIMTLIQ